MMATVRYRRTGYQNGKDRAVPWIVTVQTEHYVEVVAVSEEMASKYALKDMKTRYALGNFTVTEIERIE
jgi:hypothetical protein